MKLKLKKTTEVEMKKTVFGGAAVAEEVVRQTCHSFTGEFNLPITQTSPAENIRWGWRNHFCEDGVYLAHTVHWTVQPTGARDDKR